MIPGLEPVVAITCRTDRHRENARFLINDYVVPAIDSLNLPEPEIETAIKRNDVKNNLLIYPNPAKNVIYFQYNGVEITEIQIIELTGKLMRTYKYNHEISLNGLADGVYITSIKLANGQFFRERIVVNSNSALTD